ncbi:MAG: HAMP domain-containing histidine kinase [Turneriella sp.]|nr:HAMP domain-containing histidine kinase [Turneriella sp.]
MSESGYLQLRLGTIAPAKLAEMAFAPFRNQFAEKEISVEIHVPHNLPALNCDVSKIAWVLSIFFSNAVRYTPRWGKLWIRGKSLEKAIRLEVENSGYGIPPEQLAKLFEPSANPENPEFGRGLALVLAREIVEAHSGKIGGYTEPGVMTGFFIELPVEANPASSDNTQSQSKEDKEEK